MANPKRTFHQSGQVDKTGEARQDMKLNEEEFNLNTTSFLLPEEHEGIQKVVSITISEPGLVLLLD